MELNAKSLLCRYCRYDSNNWTKKTKSPWTRRMRDMNRIQWYPGQKLNDTSMENAVKRHKATGCTNKQELADVVGEAQTVKPWARMVSPGQNTAVGQRATKHPGPWSQQPVSFSPTGSIPSVCGQGQRGYFWQRVAHLAQKRGQSLQGARTVSSHFSSVLRPQGF